MRAIYIILFCILVPLLAHTAEGYEYEKRNVDCHIVHVVKIDPNLYASDIVKASKGRETVGSLAQKAKATIAINGGFFEIGGDKDGNPTGTLVIKGNKYKVKNTKQALIIINDGKMKMDLANPSTYLSDNISMLSGIPMLIKGGQIYSKLVNKKSSFYAKPHARTAIGLDAEGNIVIAVVEQKYSKNLNSVTMSDAQKILSKRNEKNPNDMTLRELKSIIKDELSQGKGAVKGMTMMELAKLMKDLGCKDAINLDGGGSSTLWINGRIMNAAFGDKDESAGMQVVRPVSDAVVFKLM